MTIERSSGNRLTGFYRGTVLKHLSNGFCKIWIPGVYPDEWNSYATADNLPSAEQASPLSFGANSGSGVFSYPNIGATVWCFFANDDQNCPVYFASTLGGKEANGGVWNNPLAMPGNHPDDAYIHKIHAKNSDVEVSEVGTIKIHVGSGSGSSDIFIDAQGIVDIASTKKITLTAPSIDLHASSAIVMNSNNYVLMGNDDDVANSITLKGTSINLSTRDKDDSLGAVLVDTQLGLNSL